MCATERRVARGAIQGSSRRPGYRLIERRGGAVTVAVTGGTGNRSSGPDRTRPLTGESHIHGAVGMLTGAGDEGRTVAYCGGMAGFTAETGKVSGMSIAGHGRGVTAAAVATFTLPAP